MLQQPQYRKRDPIVLTPDPAQLLTTRTGFAFTVRPAEASDAPALAEFFTHVAQDDLRFRFLSGCRTVSHDQLLALTRSDNQTENFLALAPDGILIASAMLACDATLQKGEVAIAVRADYKHRGVGWELLEHVARYAAASGIRTLESLEDSENHAAIELERDMGFTVASCDSDPTLVTVSRSLGDRAAAPVAQVQH